MAYFGGGRALSGPSAVVDAYDSNTGTQSTGVLSVARTELAATTVGSLVMFAGGADSATSCTDVVDIYDSSAGPISDASAWSTWTLSEPRFSLAATTVGTKAFFAGGGLGGPFTVTGVSDRVDIYDSSLGAPNNPAAWSTATFSFARGRISAAAAGDQALFAGGITLTEGSSVVDVYTDSTGAWTTDSLSQARIVGPEGTATIGTCVYFVGGQSGPSSSSGRIDIYDTEDGSWEINTMPVRRRLHAVTAVGHVLFAAGGLDAAGGVRDSVDRLNVLTGDWSSSASLSVGRAGLIAASAGGKALFAGGGFSSSSPTDAVDAFEPYVGQSYCAPAVANSSGAAATLDAMGSPVASANDLTLLASGLPRSVFGFFVTSQTQGFTTNPGGSQGNLCLGGVIGRYLGAGEIKNSGSGGWFELTLDLGLMPTTTGGVTVQSGQTWNFQAWHRDTVAGVATSNFTEALSVTFL